MSLIFYIGLMLGIGYLGILLYFAWRWQTVPARKIPKTYQGNTKISVLIAAKNEAHNLAALSNHLLAQKYPKALVEFLLINDHSTDNTIKVWEDLNLPKQFNIINATQIPGKKMALTQGIACAKNEVIVTTDADCLPNPNWLRSIAYIMEKQQPKFLAGPVQFIKEQSILERFQSLDFLGMMLITGVGIDTQSFFMANGANMAFEKSTFEAVGGYEGNAHIASGDDMFLIHKIAQRFPKETILFNKNPEALVSTFAVPTLSEFIHQRVRWGGKNKASKDLMLKVILGWVMLTALWLVIFPFVRYWWVILILKMIGDYFLLKQATTYFGRKRLMLSFLPSFILHTFYVAGIGFLSLFWKGRWK